MPRLSVKLLKHGTLKVYPGYPHGMLTTHADVINPDLLAFVKSSPKRPYRDRPSQMEVH